MNRHLRRIFYVFCCGFVALVGVLAYWQVYAKQTLADNPNNGLQSQRELQAPRGLILARDGQTVLAKSVKNGKDYQRVYPQGALYSNVVGYWSQRYGATGIELTENSNLSGNAEPRTLDELLNQLSGGPQPGDNVELTLDPRLQRLSYDLIKNSSSGKGAIVALNPKTGEILALASYPSYDPNNIDENFKQIQKSPDDLLLDRATQGLYPPGSTMKVITAAAALKKGVKPTDVFNDPGYYYPMGGGYAVTNYKGASYGNVTFQKALDLSINVIFAKVAVEYVGAKALYDTARAFGFGDSYNDLPLQITPSSVGPPPSKWDRNYLATAAFGQAQVQATPFEMAMVAATIANDGVMMKPRIIKEVRSPEGVLLERTHPSEDHRVLDTQTAQTLNQMMQSVVTDGDAGGAKIPGVTVAGKTGTAETPSGAPDAWFISFAPANDPKIAVAVLVHNGGDSETNAVPLAQKVMQQALREHL
ncbi:peptidoglycan D,D-transpeptidase FtsI family protein [Rubrobacter calidifluminis]|uniref:peptidoglycan D,D-transpeptidase FtsI family protein n=1 Tax=Rubrobacter calidifluminis TaxID=1392640 RepID=UPI00235E8AC8|nr:penicillin-binding protein 2 [Rubrobacter calidifluminis]